MNAVKNLYNLVLCFFDMVFVNLCPVFLTFLNYVIIGRLPVMFFL